MATIICGCIVCAVPEQHVLVVSRFGKFKYLLRSGEGVKLYNCCFESIDANISLMLEELDLRIETKTADHTFMDISMAIQYRRRPDDESIYAAVYKLDAPIDQMTAYVQDVVRSTVNKITMDQVYTEKSTISDAVKDNLTHLMSSFGYEIVATPVTDVQPSDLNLLAAMNSVLELERQYAAQKQKNEQIQNEIRNKAEAEKFAYIESGKGLAAKRSAIVDGLRESVASFSKGMNGVTPRDVLELILVTQYFDMLKDIGETGQNTVFVKHGPNAIADITNDIRNGFKRANEK